MTVAARIGSSASPNPATLHHPRTPHQPSRDSHAAVFARQATKMPAFQVDLGIAVESIRTHNLRAALTVLGLTMGVATLITVMTIVQGANIYVEQKIANLGTNVFRVARTPFAVVDFTVVTKALKNKF